MDREKVIKAMEHCIGDNCDGDKWSECEYSGHGCIDALLEDAITLLKAQEPVVMAGAELTDTEVIEKIRKAPIVLKPTVDAVPVVRCSECKYAHMTYDGECKYCDFWQEDGGDALYLDKGFYCAAGEYRDGDANG